MGDLKRRKKRLRKIVELATIVFGSHEKAIAWIYAPERHLDGKCPVYCLDTEENIKKLRWVLSVAIKHGRAS